MMLAANAEPPLCALEVAELQKARLYIPGSELNTRQPHIYPNRATGWPGQEKEGARLPASAKLGPW